MMTDKSFPFPTDHGANSALDDLFAAARNEAAAPLAAEFAARLIADAVAQQPQRRRAPGLWTRLTAALAGIGGAPGLAGLGAAGLAGLWIGVAAPGPTADLVTQFWQGAAVVSPSVAGLAAVELAGDDAVILGDSDLLSLIDGELE